MAALNEEVKLFIVQSLACYDTPSQVAELVHEEFGITVERPHVQLYDPTKRAGRHLSKKYVALFNSTREAFLSETAQIPIASKTFRLRSLQRIHDYYMSRKNYVAAQSALEQAAKEVGQLFTNRVQHGGDKDNPMLAFFQQISGHSIPVVHDVSAVIDED